MLLTFNPCFGSNQHKRKRTRQQKFPVSVDCIGEDVQKECQVKIKKRKSTTNAEQNSGRSSSTTASLSSLTPSSLHQKMTRRLSGAQFRWINEQLYTTTSQAASSMFQDDPTLFSTYHQGFSEQVSKWPINPVDEMITYVQQLPSDYVIADFGCGEAKLSRSVPHAVHSFDLIASNDYVTPCDMAHVPLPSSSVDISLFCLSLMGTNVSDFIREGVRVLKKKGTVKICEIASRFASVSDFVASLESFGLKLTKKRMLSKMFLDFEFTLVTRKGTGKGACIELKPCLYKKR